MRFFRKRQPFEDWRNELAVAHRITSAFVKAYEQGIISLSPRVRIVNGFLYLSFLYGGEQAECEYELTFDGVCQAESELLTLAGRERGQMGRKGKTEG